jgi:hypothetical protein
MTNDEFDSDQLLELWEEYMRGADSIRLANYVRAHPGLSELCSHSYPVLHRLQDIRLQGQVYRVSRCADCNERLYFVNCDESCVSTKPGVPLWFKGRSLRRWIKEVVEPTIDGEDFWKMLDYAYRGDEEPLLAIAKGTGLSNAVVRVCAIEALPRLNSKASTAVQSLLKDLVHDDDDDVRSAAIDTAVILNVATRLSRTDFLSALDSERLEVQLWAIDNADQLHLDSAIVERLRDCLKSKSQQVRHAAACTLWKLKRDQSVADVLIGEVNSIVEGDDWLFLAFESQFTEALNVLTEIARVQPGTRKYLQGLSFSSNERVAKVARDALAIC